MTQPRTRWRTWSIRLAAAVSIIVLWTLTAGADAEWALWRRYSASQALVNVAGSLGIIALGYLLNATGDVAARAARVAVLSLSVGMTVGVLELPAFFGHDYGRTFGTRDNDTWLQLAEGINRRDDELIHVHRPGSQFRGTVGGNLGRLGLPNPGRYDVDVTYDKNGFRNDIDFTRADVVAIGDSFIEAAEMSSSLTMVAELSRRLGVPVANLGQSGYGPQQELIVLKRYGVPLAPKAVLWFLFGGNDLSDIDAYEWRRQHLDQFLTPPSFSSRTFSRNALTAIARLTTPTRREPSALARRHEITFKGADGRTEVLYLDANEGQWEPRQWDIMANTLLTARDLSASIGADFLVVYVPRKLRVYQGFLGAAPDSFAHRWKPNNLPDVVRAYCQQHTIAFLDSTGPLRAAVGSGISVYLPDDVHWNAAGHRVVATAVAEQLHQMGKISIAAAGGLK